MRHLITFALLATVLFAAQVFAHPKFMSKECMDSKPSVGPKDCCRGLLTLPESALTECTALYPDDDDDEDDTNEDDDDDSSVSVDKKHHKHHKHHHRHHCIVECYFNKTGIFKDRQVVKAVALKLFSENTDASGNFQAVISTSIDTCIARDEAMKKKFEEMMANKDHPRPPPHHHDDGKHCPPKAAFLSKCVEFDAFKNCPADRKVSNAECQKLTDFMDKCTPKME